MSKYPVSGPLVLLLPFLYWLAPSIILQPHPHLKHNLPFSISLIVLGETNIESSKSQKYPTKTSLKQMSHLTVFPDLSSHLWFKRYHAIHLLRLRSQLVHCLFLQPAAQIWIGWHQRGLTMLSSLSELELSLLRMYRFWKSSVLSSLMCSENFWSGLQRKRDRRKLSEKKKKKTSAVKRAHWNKTWDVRQPPHNT